MNTTTATKAETIPALVVGSDEWHAERRKGIGGSDAAAVAGLSQWSTALDVYYEKIGEGTNEESTAMRRGTLLEPAIRQMYADETGRQVVQPEKAFVNTPLDFVRANLDGVASGEIVLECKSARDRSGWGEPGTSDIPIVYLCQVQHNMMAARMHRTDVAVLFGDFEFTIYPIEADPEFQSLLLEQEAAFWRCVQQRIPPEPVSSADIQRRWPRGIVDAVAASSRDVQAARVLSAVKDSIKSLGEIKEQAEAILKASIKDAEGLAVDGETLCTWKNARSTDHFDKTRFQRENPEIYEQYLTQSSPTRRFLLKGKCSCLDQTTSSLLPPIPTNLLPPPVVA